MNDLLYLQDTFGISGVEFKELAPCYPVIYIVNGFSDACIALHGAHVMSFTPKSHEPLLWLSDAAIYREGKAIRGGIPICWPWFGDHPDNCLPAHGFARNQFWQLVSIVENIEKETVVTLTLSDSEMSRAIWPHKFTLEVTIAVGKSLSVSLKTVNKDEKPFSITSALHSYLNVGDIQKTEVFGLANVFYRDKLSNDQVFMQTGSLHFDRELDRIYGHSGDDEIRVSDSTNTREIVVGKSGSQSTVIWNPWIDKSSKMTDFEEGGYRHMLCVEAANTCDCNIVVEPGESHTLATIISEADKAL